MKQNNIFKNERTSGGSFVFWFLVLSVLAGLDQLTKYLAFHGQFGSFLNAFAPQIRKLHYFNHNFAFSLPIPSFLMFALYALILGAIGWHVVKNFGKLTFGHRLAWVLILTGALSNVGERIALGYVRDFIYVLSGIFNLADGYIIVGVIILLFQSSLHNPGASVNKHESGIRN